MQPMVSPYYFQNNPAYPPQFNPLSPYQERLNQMQAQYNQPSAFNAVSGQQTLGLSGEIVDSIDVVKAKNVDMSGNVTFYPKSDLSEIYTKQLMPNGTSQISVYVKKPMDETKKPEQPIGVSVETINAMLGQLKTDISTEINGLKDMVGVAIESASKPSEPVKTTRGGKTDNA